jgi:NAD+ kinase
MKVAIYSRVIDDDQHNKVQQLLDELAKENIHPVIYKTFL